MYVILTSDTHRFVTSAADRRGAERFADKYNHLAPGYEATVFVQYTPAEDSPNVFDYMDTETLRDARNELYDNASTLVIDEIDAAIHGRTETPLFIAYSDGDELAVIEDHTDEGRDGYELLRVPLDGAEDPAALTRILRANGWAPVAEWVGVGIPNTWDVEVRPT